MAYPRFPHPSDNGAAAAASLFATLDVHAIKTSLGTLCVRTGGQRQNESILCWSSLLMSGHMWLAQVEHYIKGYHVILVDPPGHGDSQALERKFTLEECSQCVVDILDGLHVDWTHFVGNSWGGMLGAVFAAQYPTRIGHAILMNCTASRASMYDRISYPALGWLLWLLGGFRWPLTSKAVSAFLGPTSFRERRSVVEYVEACIRRNNGPSVSFAILSIVPERQDQHDVIKGVKTPVLVIAGSEDQTFTLSETKRMANAVPAAEFVTMDRIAHLAALEGPERINELIDKQLRKPLGRNHAQSTRV